MTVSVFSIGCSLAVNGILLRALTLNTTLGWNDPARIDSEITQVGASMYPFRIDVVVDQIERSGLI